MVPHLPWWITIYGTSGNNDSYGNDDKNLMHSTLSAVNITDTSTALSVGIEHCSVSQYLPTQSEADITAPHYFRNLPISTPRLQSAI